MKKIFYFLLILNSLLFAQTVINVELAVDTNRDNHIDFVDDDLGEDNWSRNRGAIFFYNNDSDNNAGYPDCFDNKISNTNDLRDLAIVLLKHIPDLTSAAKAKLYVDIDSQSKINLFIRQQKDYIKSTIFHLYYQLQ